MRKDAPLTIDLPSKDRDAPSWVKVGVIAAVGFVIGIAWPRLAGVKIGPSVPADLAPSAAGSTAKAARAPDAPPASVTVKGATAASPSSSAAPVASASAKAPAGPPHVAVAKGSVLNCKTDDGDSKKGKECGRVPDLDQLVAPRLRKVASCSAAEGQTGKLSFVVNADFNSGRFGWDVGRSSTVGDVEGITGCLKTIFHGVALNGVAHDNAKYTVAYTATLSAEPTTAAKGESGDKADAPADIPEPKAKEQKPVDVAAGSDVTVAWEVALVRDVPKSGQVVARLPRGTKVKVGSQKDGWFAIKYGDGFASDGWVYRGALGK
jgi:hypothetical protein